MLQINRIKIVISTECGIYQFDEKFHSGLNFISSKENTCGKSSVLIGIYYGLGFEEIIGGQGAKVLTSAYKSEIKDEEKILQVLESYVVLEIFNGKDTISIYRSAKAEGRESKLMTVYFAGINEMYDIHTVCEEMYVLSSNAATNGKGFHTFLEKFIGLELPLVSATEKGERKLYLQLLFACMFIEQKTGWSGILSGMPYLGIKDAKKRVIEYILGLDISGNEKKRNTLLEEEKRIKTAWNILNHDLLTQSYREGCVVNGIPQNPKILYEDFESQVQILKMGNEITGIDEYIAELVDQYQKLTNVEPKIVDNYEALQGELTLTEQSIVDLENQERDLLQGFMNENMSIKSLTEDLEIIRNDIINNKDAQKLRNLGADLECLVSRDVCPTCHQKIQDSLLPDHNEFEIMGIEENIKHLNSQKDMLEFALKGHKKHKEELDLNMQNIRARLMTLRRLAKSIRNDLYSVNEELSETVIYKKLELSHKIEDLGKYRDFIYDLVKKYLSLSKEWTKYLSEKENLPQKNFSEDDEVKINELKKCFVENLKKYGYKSASNFNVIDISLDTYMPIVEKFDMKFDSSASDNVRAIWAYTMALLQTSTFNKGNHVGIVLFDEPDQHSIVMKDLEQLFSSIINVKGNKQVIIGITIKDAETKAAIEKLDKEQYHEIEILDRAFKKITIS